MGCDIHVCLEVKNRDGEWVSHELYKKDRYEGGYEKVGVYNERNYSLFAALCGVRGYSPGTPKISEPKGMPNNCSKETLEGYKMWGSDGHSHSWNTLSELYEFQDKGEAIKYSGLVSQKGSEEIDKGGIPRVWCQAANFPGLVWREWSETVNILKPLIDAIEKQVRKTAWIWDAKKRGDEIRVVYWFDN